MSTPSGRPSMGILTTRTPGEPPFGNKSFYRGLCLKGNRAGMDVFVFSPQDINWMAKTTSSYIYEKQSGQWLHRNCRLPDVVYDRCFFTAREQYLKYRSAVRRLREERRLIFLGYGLKGKLDVHRLLECDERLADYLPQTEHLRAINSVATKLRTHGQVILKPQAGSQGRGVLLVQTKRGQQLQRLHTQDQGADDSATQAQGRGSIPGAVSADPAFTVRGRDARNRSIALGFAEEAALLRWLRRFTAQRSYLQQQYLLLQSRSGDAYDVRSLVQKDGSGRWQITGIAVRRGQGGSLTSNLHGGGEAQPAGEFLVSQFDSAKAESLLCELRTLSRLIPEVLEERHGRLAELGIDFGIDLNGRIWILEVNSKPGRAVFNYLHDNLARIQALSNPLLYAHYLIKQSRPGNQIRVTGFE